MTTVQSKQPVDAGSAAASLDHLPGDLLAVLGPCRDDIQAVARQDLNSTGHYDDCLLVLTSRQLGRFCRQQGQWQGTWTDLASLSAARIVEGLGVHMLVLLADGKAMAEYRCSLRHAKDMARLHRQLERQLEGKADTVTEEPPKEDDKKVRCDKCGRVIPPWSEFCVGCTSRRKVLSRLLDFVKPYRVQAITGAALAIIVMVVGLIRPWLMVPLLRDGLGVNNHGKPAEFSVLMFWVLVMAGLMIGGAVVESFRHRILAKLSSRVCRDVRERTYAHLHTLSLSFFARKPTGSLVSGRQYPRLYSFLIAILSITGRIASRAFPISRPSNLSTTSTERYPAYPSALTRCCKYPVVHTNSEYR